MDLETTIIRLKRQLLIERIVFGVFVIAVVAVFLLSRYQGGNCVILVDGKPVVCVDSAKEANDILESIKEISCENPLEAEFKQEVCVARAPRSASPMPTSRALSVARSVIVPVVNKWAIIADGQPVVGLPSKEDAARTVDRIKAHFAGDVENLLEEPQIRENISIAVAPISPELYCLTPEDAVKCLFAPKAAPREDAVYTVQSGDVAVSIARKLKLNTGELKKLNPNVNLDKLAIGTKLKVKQTPPVKYPLTVIVRNQTAKTEQIPPPTVNVSSPIMYEGKTAYIDRGKPGKRTVKIATVYENGKAVGEEIVSEEILAEPVSAKVAVGIKPRP